MTADITQRSELTPLRDDTKSSTVKRKVRYTRRQWIIFGIFCCINVGSGMCYSILAPFYPEEAEKRGVSSTVYGFVFGIFELVNFVVCPFFGKYIRVIGPNFMLNSGNFVLAICTILFGLVDKMDGETEFVVFSFVIRSVEALGQAAFMTSSYAIIAQEFTENVATTFSVLEIMYSVGMICGPTAGAILLEVGGFMFPFLVIGIILLVAAILAWAILPPIEMPEHKSNSLIQFLFLPSVAICYYSVISAAFSLTFVYALLEPHLRQFDLSPTGVGVMLVINGASYALTAVVWGWLSDKYVHPKILCGIGGILVSIAFIFIGPAPFIPVEPLLWLTVVGLVIHGIGAAGEYVSGFLDAIQEAARNGYADNLETYAMVAGLWTSGLALGSFIGPSISGILNDVIGFRRSSVLVLVLHIGVSILCFGYYIYFKKKQKRKVGDKEPLTTSVANGNTKMESSDSLELYSVIH